MWFIRKSDEKSVWGICFIHFMVKYFKFEYKNRTHHLELYEVIM